ncbi:MAG: hypothetical protein SF028_12165 [Candidatus Sumerlaeia bacterium]|nr:hypothetical protein [Candidatus Sumerlaeia bacterium]
MSRPDAEETNYLKKLAQSVLDKERKASAAPPPAWPPPEERKSSTGAPWLGSAPTAPAAPPQTPRAPQPVSPSSATGVLRREVVATGPGGAYLTGTILFFEDETIAVYRGKMKDRDYDLVYALTPSGRVKPQGIPIANYDVRAIGRIAPNYLDHLATNLRWERDLVIFHLLDYEDVRLIPEVFESGGESKSSSAVPLPNFTTPPPEQLLVRGRRVSIKFGSTGWEAVYWGKDELGSIVAHRTHERWALMHLDLKRFSGGVEYGAMLQPSELSAVEADLTRGG